MMIENDIKQLEADIEQERLNAEEASNLIEKPSNRNSTGKR